MVFRKVAYKNVASLILEIDKKKINLDLEDGLNNNSNLFLKISSKIQFHSFLHSGNSYEEDLRIWKVTFS